jgi:hypothetical protein
MIGLRLTSESVSIAAGGTESFEAIVVNEGSTVDEIAVDVVGPAAAWSTVTPSAVRLFPGDRASVEIRLQPVLGPQLASGRHDFAVRAQSTTSSSSSVVAEATMMLGAAPVLSAALEPRLARGRWRARQRLQVVNVGNSAALVSISASDPDDQLTFRHDTRPFDLVPGATRRIKVSSAPTSRKSGRGVPHPMQVTVAPEGATPTVLDGRVAFDSLLPGWMTKVAAVVGVVAALLVAFIVLRTPSTPESSAVDGTATTNTTTVGFGATTTAVAGADSATSTPPNPDSTTVAGASADASEPGSANGPDNGAPTNGVLSAGPQPWTFAAGGTDGSVVLVNSDGTKAATLAPGGSNLDPAPAWSLDRTQVAFVTRRGSSTAIAFAAVPPPGSGPGNAVPLLPCQTCGTGGDITAATRPRITVGPTQTFSTSPPKVTIKPVNSSTTTPRTIVTIPSTAAPIGTTTTIDHPLFLGPDSVAWFEQSCSGKLCSTAIVFADATLREQSRARVSGVVTTMAADPVDQEVLAVVGDRLLVARPGGAVADDGGPFSGVSVDNRGHTIGWHSDRPGEASVLEDVDDHHTINTGQAGVVTSLTYSPDGAQVGYVSDGRAFVANADFTAPREVTPSGMTVASVA